MQPIENAVNHLPKVYVFDQTVDSLCHGALLGVPGVCKVESDIQVDEMVAVMTLKDELIGFGTAKMISRDMVKQEKGAAVKMEKIFLPIGTYPKMIK